MTEKQIQEIMALVDEFGNSRRRQGNDEYSPESAVRRYSAQYGKDADETRAAIESAMREQVPEGTAAKVRDGIANWIETNVPHREFWTPEVVDLIRSIECKDSLIFADRLSAAPQPAQAEQPKAQREPMTDEQISRLWASKAVQNANEFARAVERFHGITKDGK